MDHVYYDYYFVAFEHVHVALIFPKIIILIVSYCYRIDKYFVELFFS